LLRLDLVLAVLCLLVGWSVVTRASEQSEALYSKGLVEFHAGRYEAALQLFDQAVGADPQDVYARYYRGVTRGRLHDYQGAIDDLRQVLAAKPDLPQGNLELGAALVQAEQYREAVPWLTKAQQVGSLEAEASFFLGIAQLRLGDPTAASENFQRAARTDPSLNNSARYYQGVAAYQRGDWETADTDFRAVIDANPDTEIAKQAAAFLARGRGAGAPPARAYTVFAAVGIQYDTNVQLAPSDQQVKTQQNIHQQSDGRVTLTAGGAYMPWQGEHGALTLGYEFFQSLHFELHQFNLQDHRPVVQFAFDYAPFQFGVQGRYDYYLQETSSFLQQVMVVPWVSMAERDIGRSELVVQTRYQDFLHSPFKPVLDGFDYGPLLRQYFYLRSPDQYVFGGFRYDHLTPQYSSGNAYEYDGYEGNAGFGALLPAEITATLEWAFRQENYASASGGRRDQENLLGLAFERPLTEHFDLTLAYFGDFNNSNQEAFNYTRNVGSVSVGYRY
jgi:tetratricopeptide (TPR) repeat protein